MVKDILAPSTHVRGLSAEGVARQALTELGYTFIESNFRWKGGEIDLIFEDPAGLVVFVEVRSAAHRSEWLRYTITSAKQHRLINTAFTYLHRRAWTRARAFRFDMVWVESGKPEHWKNVMLT